MNRLSAVLVALGSLFAISSGFAAPPVRLFQVFCERFVADDHGVPILDLGALNALGEFEHRLYVQLPATTTVPPEVLNRNLFPFSAFPAFDALGPQALANFKLVDDIRVGSQDYFVIAVADHPKLDVGNLVNLSARGSIPPGGEPLIVGFVIEDHPRRVLVRGVGPALRGYGVTTPLANPALKLFRAGESVHIAGNEDWDQQSNADEIEVVAAAVGAFPLPRGSRDAALLVELPPGVYTAHVGTVEATGGSALLEIYVLP